MKLPYIPSILIILLSIAQLPHHAALAADATPKTTSRIRSAGPCLSYLPIYMALRKGFFSTRGFDVEMIQMSVNMTAPALLNQSTDYTIIPSTIATAAARGAPAKVIFFASV